MKFITVEQVLYNDDLSLFRSDVGHKQIIDPTLTCLWFLWKQRNRHCKLATMEKKDLRCNVSVITYCSFVISKSL